MITQRNLALYFAFIALSCGLAHAQNPVTAAAPPIDRGRQVREYRDFSLSHDGNAVRGRELFNNDQKAACVKCHSADGTSSKAGPDLLAIGDKFPRSELIRAVLEPSVEIAVGFGSTIVETKGGDEITGVIKNTSAEALELVGADGKRVMVALRDIKTQRGSSLSLMPEGLQAGLTKQEFADLIEYLVSLKQPDSAVTSNRGMPSEIPELSQPVKVSAFFGEEMRFPYSSVKKPGDVRSGLVWFGQLPGLTNRFAGAHQSGKIWLLGKNGTNVTKTVFADISRDVFSERGPNGLLSIAFHPAYRENHRYFLKHQVFEEGKIATIVVERKAADDGLADSGEPSRRIWKVVSTTQDHSGGCIAFGPDGFLYIGMGDTGPQQDPQGHGQDLSLHLGKILRMDIDHSAPGLAYAIPVDNPFRNDGKARPEIWAYGFREPWRFSFDSLTHELWVGDVGQDRVEEVSIVRRGENHGWNVYEGFEPFSNRYRKESEKYVRPVFAYRRKFGNSVTGGFVYRGNTRSSYYGAYICGDYTSKRIFAIKQQDRMLQEVRQIAQSPESIASFASDERGEIYVVGYEGMVYHLELAAAKFDSEIKTKP